VIRETLAFSRTPSLFALTVSVTVSSQFAEVNVSSVTSVPPR
jgi:hypothetical protein